MINCRIIRRSTRRSSTSLHGISEWREKYSSNTAKNKAPIQSSSSSSSLPLLLLPFPPTQILLPGQSTTLQFKHGKYMDLIDDALTNYCGVLGFSILGDDGLLPTVVLCEVIEEELEVKMGYRGFSSMEVGIRAVGRARRGRRIGSIVNGARSDLSSDGEVDNSYSSYYLYEKKKTAIEDIHLGQCVEWRDDDIIAQEKKIDAVLDCVSDIKSLLMPASSAMQTHSESDGILQRQTMLFDKAYELVLTHLEGSNSCPLASDMLRSNQFEALSWSYLAACDGLVQESPSLVLRALETKDTLVRLRLCLAVLLDFQMSTRNNADEDFTSKIGKDAVGGCQDTSFH